MNYLVLLATIFLGVLPLAVVCCRLFLGLAVWGENQSPSPTEDRTSEIEQLDTEMARLQERISAQEQSGGSNTWLAFVVLWQNRRRLSDLKRRRYHLLEARRRRKALFGSSESVCTAESIGRSATIQAVRPRLLSAEDIRRSSHDRP